MLAIARSVRSAGRLVNSPSPITAKFMAPFVQSGVRQATIITVPVPQSDEEFITKDSRTMNNAHFFAFDGHKRIKQMAEFWGVVPAAVPKFPVLVNLVASFGPTRFDTVYRGNRLTADQVGTEPPQVQFPLDKAPRTLANGPPASNPWTLLLIDAGPARSTSPEPQRVHWMVANIPSNDISQGETLVDYTPAYPADGGDHCFVFVLMQQSDDKPLLVSSVKTDDFNATTFIQENNLKPYGLSFYQAGEEVIEEVVNENKVKRDYPSKYGGL